jgi:uncharacterized protein (TIGR03435 family)
MTKFRFLLFFFLSISLLGSGMLLLPGSLAGQTSAAKPPQASAARRTFDVATIKPSPPLDRAKLAADMQAGKMPRFGPHVSASRAEYLYMPLRDLIALAYGMRNYQVTGPDWMKTERFDIEATMPEGASKDDAPGMLRALLEDRFKLAAHKDTEEHKVLALLVGKNGPKLKESTTVAQPVDPDAPLKPNEVVMDGPEGPIRISRNSDGSMVFDLGKRGKVTQTIDAQNQAVRLDSSMVTMTGFAETLSTILAPMGGQLVVDMTGLKGNYEVAMEISFADLMAMARSQGDAPPPPPGDAANAGAASAAASTGPATASDPGASSIYQSVKQLGLELEERKAPVEELIVDHVEKTATEN